MPTYRVETNQGTFDVEADREPTTEEVLAQIQGMEEQAMAAPERLGAVGGLTAGLVPGAPVPGAEGVGQAVKNMGLEGGGATLGQTVGAPLGPVGVAGGGAVGGLLGNIAAQLTTPGKEFSFGEAGGAMLSGMIPGASLAKAGAKEVVKEGVKFGVGNIASKAVETGISEGRLPTASEMLVSGGAGFLGAPLTKYLDAGAAKEASRVARSQDSVRRETLKLGRQLGLKIPPSVVNPNAVNNTLNSLGGKAAVAQQAVLENAPKINAAVRAEIGLPADAPLSDIALNTQRVAPNLVYEEVGKVSDTAANLLGQFKQAQADTNELYAAYRAAQIKDPSLLTRAKQAEAMADAMRQGLKKEVGPDLFKRFDEARTQLAKIGLAERSIRLGDGNADAAVFGDALEAGEKLTGNFKTIGRFQSAFGKYVQEQAKTPPSGVDYLKMASKFGAGGGLGYALGGTPGAIAGTVAMAAAEAGARRGVLSDRYQQALANPFYGRTGADAPAQVARTGLMAAGREPTLEDDNNLFLRMSNPAPFTSF